jgi:serine/threonine protein kinase
MLDNNQQEDDGIKMKIIDDATQRIIDEVREKTKRKFDKSKLLLLATPDNEDDDKPAAVEDFILPRLDIHDLILGKVLGQGGFGTVIEILPRVVISGDDVDDNNVPPPPPPQDDIVEDKKNSPRSAAGNGYTFNWWKLQWDENIKNDGVLGNSFPPHDCIPGDIVSLLDYIVHISTTAAAASSSSASPSSNSTVGLSVAVGDSILPLCSNIEKRQQLSHVGLHSGVEYVVCSVQEGTDVHGKEDLLISLKPSYPLGPQFQTNWPITLLASHVPIWTSRSKTTMGGKMMTQSVVVTTKQRGGRDHHPMNKSLPSSCHDNNETIFHDHWTSSSRGKGMTVHPDRRRKCVSHDVSRMRCMHDDTTIELHLEHDVVSPLPPRQEEASSSHYFSFVAWRDSKAGEEGNDVITSPQQTEKRNSTLDLANESYVIKKISQSIVDNDFNKFLQAAKDLATETNFLCVLGQHPHILNIRAVGGQGDFFSPDFFLVLDRLHGTLYDKIEKSWKIQLYDLENSFFVYDRAAKVKTLWNERMRVMKDLAGALSYMHDMRIIYRDIKPDNVGFDGRGIVKLFDFGLAREIYAEEDTGNGTYKLTYNTGSLRYMAPEVFNKWPYNFLADTFSFGILLWEVAALERPYTDLTPSEIREMVIKWGERPKTKDGWSERVVDLMTTSWDSNYRKRPTMKEIEANLEMEIADS